MSNDLPALPNGPQPLAAPGGFVFDAERFAQLERAATAVANSQLVPPAFRGKVADVVAIFVLADQVRMNPIMALQAMDIVHGRPSWKGQAVIALVNASGQFRNSLRFREVGTPGAADYAVTAWAIDAQTGDECSFTASMAMARAEGWATRAGNKYASMPQLMLRYRASVLFARTYCPQVLMGLREVTESEDMGQERSAPTPARLVVEPSAVAAPAQPRADVLDAMYEPVAAPVPVDSPSPSPASPPTPAVPPVAAPSEGDGPVDPAEHQRLANAAMRALDALTPDGRRRVREAAGVPHGAHLAKQPDAVLRAIPALATAEAEREAQRKASHHPSWASAKPGFFAQLAEIPTGGAKVTGDDVAALCERLGRPRPSAMAPAQRDKLLGWLRTPEGRAALGLPPLEAMPAAEPADEQTVTREAGDENTDGGEE